MIRQLTRGTKLGLYGVLVLLLACCMITSLISAVPTAAYSETPNLQVLQILQHLEPLSKTGQLAQIPAGLHMDGVLIKNAANDRFYMAGLNMEMFRDYDGGCDWVTTGQYAIRAKMAERIRGLGVNVVRLNYAYRFLTPDNLTKYLDMATELATRGIYIMPADHTYTGGVLTNSSAAYPMMKQIVDGMRARGLGNYLIMGGFNEPGPDISVSAWERAYQNMLTYLRNTAQFDGVVVIDGTGWSTLLDVAAFKRLTTFDANLRGGTANVIFSHHLYPNITGLPAQIFEAANQVPLMIGELGQENPGASPLRPQYVKDVIAAELNAGFANGHNGLFAWIWAWCDSNKMLEDWDDPAKAYTDNSPLTSHGVLWRDNYFKLMPGSGVPPPPTVIVQQPTQTRTPTRTILPTNSPRPPTRSPTPTATDPVVVIITNTPEPPPVLETWQLDGTIGDMPIHLTITRR